MTAVTAAEMTGTAVTDLAIPLPTDVDEQLEQLRSGLTGYCYRMLGSPHEAEDAVQETLLRAWRGFGQYTGRAPLRAWVFRIATNVCVDMLRGRKRRALPMDLGGPSRPGHDAGPALPESTWVLPMPDGRVEPAPGDPAEQAVANERIRLAFVAALQHLLPRQRAVVILRDVLRWKASEVAQLLGTTVVSVNSALQRGRAALASLDVAAAEPIALADPETQLLLERYIDAFERFDVEKLVAILHEDATLSMPPFALWLHGLDDLLAWFAVAPDECRTSQFVPAGTANGLPAFGTYRATGPDGGYEAFSIQLPEPSGDRIAAINVFVDTALFPLFGLPLTLTPAELHARRDFGVRR
jgi:RNA polymerase sigma-70 factor (ECF subfamily)